MMHLTSTGHNALQSLLDSMSPAERERLDILERIKARILRTADRDGQVATAFSDLLTDLVTRTDNSLPLGPGNRAEARALVLTGRTGAGKSSLLARTISAHPQFPGYGAPRSGCRAVSVLTPAPCNPKALGLEICRILDYPLATERSLPYIWATVRDRLEFLGKFVLHLDEIHNVLETANVRELTQLRTMMKTILVSPTWPVVLILSGLPEVIPFLEGPTERDEKGGPKADTKGELRRRSVFVHLASLVLPDDAAMIAAALRDIAHVAGMSMGEDAEHTVIPRLIHASLNELGTTMQIAQEAIGQGLNARPRSVVLGTEQFRLAYKARTGCSDSVNPFVVADWQKLDCTLVLKTNREAADGARLARAVR